MTRAADPERKPALLEQIVDYLVDKPLSALTFRGLANALGVSSFTLVYHFGTRDELIREIIGTIANRRRAFETVLDPETVTLDSYFDGLRHSFETTLLPRNQALQRLEFEAQMLEALTPDHAATKAARDELHSRATATLVALGLDESEAACEGEMVVDTFYGIQVALVVSADTDRARRGFERAMQYHRDRITSRVANA